MQEQPADHPVEASDPSPEAHDHDRRSWRFRILDRLHAKAGPGTRFFAVARRVWIGVYNDGFIHAGNLAYMALLSLFPFFIAVAAIFAAIGEPSQRDASIDAFLAAAPPSVAKVIGPVARDVVASRQGWLLWAGGLIGLWTASSLVETIRDILHRAYKTPPTRAFWQYRLVSMGVIFGSVLLLLISLGLQVAITAVEEVVRALFPQIDTLLAEFVFSRLVAALALFGSMYLLFVSLTPRLYQKRGCPKWPGAVLVAAWWVLLTIAMPIVLRNFFAYDLTYGSLAGVMIALFFFWLVGLGIVVGAELNAALAVASEFDEMTKRSGEEAAAIRDATWEESE